MQKFFATCPKGLESLVFNELQSLNVHEVKETVAGVSFSGDYVTAMRVCLYSRYASRILLVLNTFNCEDDTDLYMGANGIAYESYFEPSKTIAVSFNGSNNSIRNTQYGALRVKDAVCDRFVACSLPRPDVQKKHPDVHIIATLKKGQVTVSLDLSGSAQFWREYNRSTGIAPLKENLAAAMVTRSGFTGESNFVDPMCGSGTLLLEAASIATDTAPGIMRRDYGFKHLKGFDAEHWNSLLNEAHERSKVGREKARAKGLVIYGFDADPFVISRAQENIKHASFEEFIKVEHRPLKDLINPCTSLNDLPTTVVTNPPYGERMGNFNELIILYTLLGQKLREQFNGGTAAVISTSAELLSCLHLATSKSYKLFNGALECQLRVFKLGLDEQAKEQVISSQEPISSSEVTVAPDFANRLKKNLKQLNKWAQREEISAYRVYDGDLPNYNAAIDRYNDFYVIQEYQAPATIKPYVAKQRLLDLIAATIAVTQVPGEQVIVKSREKQKGDSQYVKREDATGDFLQVMEGDLYFKVNLSDYLDTGLFLDARPIRRIIRSLAANKTFLNLFAYTATASVAAAKGGALTTTSVDMSRTYLDWGVDNFKANSLDPSKHNFVQADCLAWLSQDQAQKFDLIYIDPPTFSNSKRMEKSFDVQRDHLLMLGNLTRHLNDQGTVIFCTNKRGFKLDPLVSEYGFTIEDITKQTFDQDFKRDLQLHSCFKLVYDQSKQTKEPEALVTNFVRPRWSKDINVATERFTYHGLEHSEDGIGAKGRTEHYKDHSVREQGRFKLRANNNRSDSFKRNEHNNQNNRQDRSGLKQGKDRVANTPKKTVRVWGPQGLKEL